nr:MAG TPA: hypothetical protein [Caudoviricetes sp.]
MTVGDVYLVTKEFQPIQILTERECTTIYVGCSQDIPYCMLDRNVINITQSMYAIVLIVD